MRSVRSNVPIFSTLVFLQNAAVLIKNILDKLGRNDLKSFKFQLRNFKKEGYDCVPLSKLEDKDTMDIATLLTDHYGCQEALWVTRDILQKINQRELVSQLESHKGKKQIHLHCTQTTRIFMYCKGLKDEF